MDKWRKQISRRKLLQLVGYSVTALPIAALTPRLAWPRGQISKEAANYQNHPHNDQQCAGCRYFISPNSCEQVQGKISPQGWCRLYSPKQG